LFCGWFWFVFPQVLILKHFSGSLSGSFCPILEARPFVFNNFSGSFLQNQRILSHNFDAKKLLSFIFNNLHDSRNPG